MIIKMSVMVAPGGVPNSYEETRPAYILIIYVSSVVRITMINPFAMRIAKVALLIENNNQNHHSQKCTKAAI
jgi:hypothetical protein